MRVRLLVAVGLCVVLSACGSAQPAATPRPTQPEFAPFSSNPPAAVGTGLVCGVAADRVLRIADHVDLSALARGSAAPTSPIIREAIAQYAASRSAVDRNRAAGLIVGQCAAYGFYIVTYRACLRPSMTRGAAPTAALTSCIARRRWTVYTQQ